MRRTRDEIERMQDELADSLLEGSAVEPLAEEEEAPQFDPVTRASNDPTHRRLRAIAGADNAYVFLVINQDDQVALEFTGVLPENLPALLRQVADAVA